MTELTKEWLLRTIAELEEERDSMLGVVNEDAAMALAAMKLALASLEAEESGRNPVLAYADIYRDMAKQGVESIPVWSVITDLERNIAPLYSAPPTPVSLTEEQRAMLRDMDDEIVAELDEEERACRVAMLQAGNHTEQHLDMVVHSGDDNEKVDCRLTFDQWLSQQNEPIDVDCGCVTTEAFYHWLRVAYEAGNSPVTSCGWVMVPKVPTEAMCETGHIGVDVYTGLATEGDGYYSIGGEDAARVWEFMIAMAPKQENTMDYITKLSPKLVSVGMFEQLSFHDGFSLKCRELGIHASKLGHIELSKKAQDLMISASLQQHDQLVDNMASLIELMADSYMRNTANTLVIPDGYVLVPNDMTPQMMRSVQRDSSLGTFASAHLKGAFDMYREFWSVAIAAAQK